MPNETRIDAGLSKVVLRKVLEGKFPSAIENRWDKLEFGTPERKILSSEDIAGMVDYMVTSDSFRNRPYRKLAICKKMTNDLQKQNGFQILKSENLW